VAIGGAGNDRVFGQDGNDGLRGDDGDDFIDGGAGNDTIEGNAGADRMLGGAGADRFIFNALSDAAPVSAGGSLDTILDFNQAEGDLIDISRIDANLTQAGDQAFSLVSAFTRQAGQAVLTNNNNGTRPLTLDQNGDGVADFALIITVGERLGPGALEQRKRRALDARRYLPSPTCYRS
jgi:serralysin